jgi:hypothetical protein
MIVLKNAYRVPQSFVDGDELTFDALLVVSLHKAYLESRSKGSIPGQLFPTGSPPELKLKSLMV